MLFNGYRLNLFIKCHDYFISYLYLKPTAARVTIIDNRLPPRLELLSEKVVANYGSESRRRATAPSPLRTSENTVQTQRAAVG